jgi:hypothetical protein
MQVRPVKRRCPWRNAQPCSSRRVSNVALRTGSCLAHGAADAKQRAADVAARKAAYVWELVLAAAAAYSPRAAYAAADRGYHAEFGRQNMNGNCPFALSAYVRPYHARRDLRRPR